MVDESIFTPAANKSFLRSTLVFLESLMLSLIIIWSSRAVVFLFLPHLPRRLIVTSLLLLTIRPTVDLGTPSSLPISLTDFFACSLKPQSKNSPTRGGFILTLRLGLKRVIAVLFRKQSGNFLHGGKWGQRFY